MNISRQPPLTKIKSHVILRMVLTHRHRTRFRTRRPWYKRRYNKFKKKLRSRHTVARIAQRVHDHNTETKVFDQYCVDYPYVSCNHNTFSLIFDNLTKTLQGVSDEPGTTFAKNRIGSSINPSKLWIKGLIQINSSALTGYPNVRVLVRLILVRRNIVQTAGAAPALPTGVLPMYAQVSQTNLLTYPNNFLANMDQRQCTVVYDKVHGIQVPALTQSNVAPNFSAAGNSISKTFDLNINLKKWTRGKVDYSFRELAVPTGNQVPKKYAFQLWAIPWINTGYDPDYTFTYEACQILAQSRMYFKDA